MSLQQHQLIKVMQAPTVKLLPFDGNPLNYFPFIRAFEENVERAFADSASRLARLIPLCIGEAARVIESCSSMVSEVGYPRARELLKERFGDKYTICDHWARKLEEGGNRTDLRAYGDELRSCYEALNYLETTNEMESQRSLTELVEMLPHAQQNKWYDLVYDLKTKERKRPSLLELVAFVERAGEKAADRKRASRRHKGDRTPSKPTAYASTAVGYCHLCDEAGHALPGCEAFQLQNPDERLETAAGLRLCFACLETGHTTQDCEAKAKCSVNGCRRMHAPLLHAADWKSFRESSQGKREERESPNDPPQPREGTGHYVSACYHTQGKKIALPLVPVRVTSNKTGKTIDTFALLDSGSSVSLCHEQLLKDLEDPGKPGLLKLTTIEKTSSMWRSRMASITVRDLRGECEVSIPEVYTRADLNLGHNHVVTADECEQWPHLRGLDIHHVKAGTVALLIGQDCPEALVPRNMVVGAAGEPYAVRTCLGWSVSGPISSPPVKISTAKKNQHRINTAYVQGARNTEVTGPDAMTPPSRGAAVSSNNSRAESVNPACSTARQPRRRRGRGRGQRRGRGRGRRPRAPVVLASQADYDTDIEPALRPHGDKSREEQGSTIHAVPHGEEASGVYPWQAEHGAHDGDIGTEAKDSDTRVKGSSLPPNTKNSEEIDQAVPAVPPGEAAAGVHPGQAEHGAPGHDAHTQASPL
jgi:hypothetical protein